VTAMVIWTPRDKCEGSIDSHHDDTSFAMAPVAVLEPVSFRYPDKPSFESTVDVCIVCSVFAFNRVHRRREVQKVYQTASTGKQ
jgi:hypothetical protein